MLQNILLKFITVDGVCSLVAKAISKLMQHASRNGGESWDKAKAIIKQINIWTSLFDQVYADDEMSRDEEDLVAEAIKNQTKLSSIVEIIKK